MERLRIALGKAPVNRLKERSRKVRVVENVRLLGKTPVKWFLAIFREVRFGKEKRDGGGREENRFEDKSSSCR